MTATPKDWACYYEDIGTKSGMHDATWNDPKVVLDFDNILVIYHNYDSLFVLTKQYEPMKIYKGTGGIKKSKNKTHYCFEMPSMALQQIAYNKVDDVEVRFTFQKKETAKGQTKHCKSQFRGFISTQKDSYRIGFGAKNKAKFNFNKGYNFHSSSQGDTSQKLIF